MIFGTKVADKTCCIEHRGWQGTKLVLGFTWCTNLAIVVDSVTHATVITKTDNLLVGTQLAYNWSCSTWPHGTIKVFPVYRKETLGCPAQALSGAATVADFQFTPCMQTDARTMTMSNRHGYSHLHKAATVNFGNASCLIPQMLAH